MKNRIEEIADWFVIIKAPGLKNQISDGLLNINTGLTPGYKNLFGFMLFSYSMNHGPLSFIEIETLAEQIGVTEELKFYANDWVNHSNKTKHSLPHPPGEQK